MRCSSLMKSNVYCSDWMRHKRISQERPSSCRCSTTSHEDQETIKKNGWQMPNSFLCMQRRFGKGQWSVIGPGSANKWYCISEDYGTILPKECWWNLQKADV